MNRNTYIIDGDQHLAELKDQTGAEMEAMIWQMDQEGALLWPDEYQQLQEELAWYDARPVSALEDFQQRRQRWIRAFFAAHPEPPPATHPDGTEQTLPDGRVVVWRNGQWELKFRSASVSDLTQPPPA